MFRRLKNEIVGTVELKQVALKVGAGRDGRPRKCKVNEIRNHRKGNIQLSSSSSAFQLHALV